MIDPNVMFLAMFLVVLFYGSIILCCIFNMPRVAILILTFLVFLIHNRNRRY